MGKIIGSEFVSDNGIKYSLYEGESIIGNTTSDICFIMLDNYPDLDDVLFDGNKEYELVGWFYGAFMYEDFINDFKDIIEEFVKKYEEKRTDIVNYLTKGIKEKKEMSEEKIMYSDTLYRNTTNSDDVVTIKDILGRYIELNDSVDKFESYVKSGFINETGVREYVPIKKKYTVTVKQSYLLSIDVEAASPKEAEDLADYIEWDKYDYDEESVDNEVISIEEVK